MGSSDPDRFKPGGLGCHEALHMVSYLASAVEEEVVEHPAVAQNEEWLKLAQTAAKALADLYQAIGAEHLKWDQCQPEQGGGGRDIGPP